MLHHVQTEVSGIIIQLKRQKQRLFMKELTVVDESRRAEPQLSAAFAGGVHHAEVVDPGPQHGAVGGTQLGDDPQQDLHALADKPGNRNK